MSIELSLIFNGAFMVVIVIGAAVIVVLTWERRRLRLHYQNLLRLAEEKLKAAKCEVKAAKWNSEGYDQLHASFVEACSENEALTKKLRDVAEAVKAQRALAKSYQKELDRRAGQLHMSDSYAMLDKLEAEYADTPDAATPNEAEPDDEWDEWDTDRPNE